MIEIHLIYFLSVLFIADARITFDSFRNCMIATATSKTIITLNPGSDVICYIKDSI